MTASLIWNKKNSYFFHGVDLAVYFSFDFENLSEGSLTQFVESLKIFQSCGFLHGIVDFLEIIFLIYII
jgi:hypothetical protein